MLERPRSTTETACRDLAMLPFSLLADDQEAIFLPKKERTFCGGKHHISQ